MNELFARILARWSGAWLEVSASAIGAGASWFLAQRLFGHQHPVFAAISTIVCLAPGLPSHSKQTVGLLSGVATGIVIGELSLLVLPDGMPMLSVIVVTFVAMMVAASYGQTAVVPIQAGVSTILIVTFGPAEDGLVRMVDVGVGAVIGLLFGQALILAQYYHAKGDPAESPGAE